MTSKLKTDDLDLEYIESEIYSPVLWESHCHAEFEMIAVSRGDINVMLEGKIYRLKKNQTIIIPPLSYHSVTANEKGTYCRVTVLFGEGAIPKVLSDGFKDSSINIATLGTSLIERLKEICEKGDGDFYAPLAKSLMIQIFYEINDGANAQESGQADEFLQKSILYIDAHLQEKILLDDIARHVSRSKSSFCHLFEERMNVSPKQYVLQKKLALASKLISEGVAPTAAATMVGYDNYSNFYRIYRKNLGKSPSQKMCPRAISQS